MKRPIRARLSFASLLVVSLTALVAFGAGLAAGAGTTIRGGGAMERQVFEGRLLTSPFLECMGEENSDRSLATSRASIALLIDQARAADPSLAVSVYIRDLHDGPWIGINEREPFIAASLLKVPVLLHAMARVEQDPTLLERSFVFPGEELMPSPANLGDLDRMEEGAAYTFEELLERMIVRSDNHAKDLVLTDVDPREVDGFLAMAGFGVHQGEEQALLDARGYASLFRMLYGSTLLSRASSEFALSLLSRGRWPDGLRRDLPDNVLVASKFGVHRGTPQAGGTQLHECGIVYGPSRPYVICVLTRSTESNVAQLADIIARVSHLVYAVERG
jgi:beta-lactamase class A